MSFVTKIVEKGVYTDPYSEAPAIHRRFTKYSKGFFPGPIMKIKFTKAKITIKASFDYEDGLLAYALKVTDDPTIDVTGSIISGDDFSDILKKHNFPPQMKVVASKGQSKNFSVVLKEAFELDKNDLSNALDELFKTAYVLLSFTSKQSGVSFKCKAKPPTPSKKDPDDDTTEKRIGFQTLTLANNDANVNLFVDMFMPDHKKSVSAKSVKEIVIENNYNIEDLVIPKEKDSKLLRLKTVRKGKLKRIVTIDGKEFLNNIDMNV